MMILPNVGRWAAPRSTLSRRGLIATSAALSVVPLTINVVAPPTLIAGATINGATQPPGTLATLVAAIPSGGSLVLPAGYFTGPGMTASVNVPCTIAGAGMGLTTLDISGFSIAQGKGLFCPTVTAVGTTPQVTFQDMTLRGAAVSDDNGAGIRDGADNNGFIANRVEFTANQDGALTFMSPFTFNSCSFHDNGAGDGFSHEIYLGNGGGVTTGIGTLINVTSTCGTQSTHALKSRLVSTTVSGGTYTQNPDSSPTSVGGSVMDFPEGGTVAITGSHLVLTETGSLQYANNWFIGYALENGNALAFGNTLRLHDMHVTDSTGSGGIIGAGQPGCNLVIQGSIYDGPIAPQLTGWANVTGAFTQASN